MSNHLNSEAETIRQAILPLGFSARPRRAGAYHFTGALGGRPADIYVTHGTRGSRNLGYTYVGHTLEITAPAPLKTRVVFGTRNETAGWINRRFNLKEFDARLSGFGDYSLYGLEERWSRDFLADHEISAALREILADEKDISLFSLQVRPDHMTLLLRTYLRGYTPERLRRWTDAFAKIVDAATRLFPPSRPVEASAWERWSQKNRHLMVWVGVGVFFGIVALIILLGALGCGLLLILASLT